MQTKLRRKSWLLALLPVLALALLLAGFGFVRQYSEQIKNRLHILDPAKTAFSVFTGEEEAAERLSALCVDEAAFQSLMDSRREAAQPLLTDLRFSGGGLFRDWGSGCWYYSLKEGSEEAFDPLVAYTGRSAGVRLAVLGSVSPEQISRGGYSPAVGLHGQPLFLP